MADIKQAAKWMQEGKRVTRPKHKGGMAHGLKSAGASPNFARYIWADGQSRIVGDERLPVTLLLDSLLADDWEIAE